MKIIDTHTHLDGEEFDEDRAEVMMRAKEAGVGMVFLPAIDVKTSEVVLKLSQAYPGYAYPMIGLHPEEVKADWKEQLKKIEAILDEHLTAVDGLNGIKYKSDYIAIGKSDLISIGAVSLKKNSLRLSRNKWSGLTRRDFL